MRLTKIIGTIGPACEQPDQIKELIHAGVNVFRLNFKHNTVEWHSDMIERINSVADEEKVSIGTLIDLQGPEIRILLATDFIEIEKGELLFFDPSVLVDESQKGLSITHPEIIKYLKDGQKVVAADGEFSFEVVKKSSKVYLHALNGGVLKHRKTLNIPGADFPFPVLIQRDFEGLQLAKRKEIDYIALSFVRSPEDVKTLRKEMAKLKINAQVISKIETQQALDKLDEIIAESDGIMVARGDLGVELPFEQVPFYQKQIINKSIQSRKLVITATQMLSSMVSNSRPTRAEVSDIANASFDLTDAVMVSDETAAGKYPTEVIQVLDKTLKFNEAKFAIDTRERFAFTWETTNELVCEAAYDLYVTLKSHQKPLDGFIVFTASGSTAKILSSLRPYAPIIAVCNDQAIIEKLSLSYAVQPVMQLKDRSKTPEILTQQVDEEIEHLKKQGLVKSNQRFIVIHGNQWGAPGKVSTLRLVTID